MLHRQRFQIEQISDGARQPAECGALSTVYGRHGCKDDDSLRGPLIQICHPGEEWGKM